MEKIIKLSVKENCDIDIFINDTLKYTILASKKEIFADKIFEILDPNIGDLYSIQVENPQNKYEKIIDNFQEFLQGIISQANIILQSPEDTFVEGSLTAPYGTEKEQQEPENHTESQN